MSAEHEDLLTTSDGTEILRLLVGAEYGWSSAMDLSWSVAPDDSEKRRQVRGILHELTRRGVLQRLYVRHRGEPLFCVKNEPAVLAKLLNEEANE